MHYAVEYGGNGRVKAGIAREIITRFRNKVGDQAQLYIDCDCAEAHANFLEGFDSEVLFVVRPGSASVFTW